MKKNFKSASPVEDQALYVYFDGACEPFNPGGNMGFGFLIKQGSENGTVIHQDSGYKPMSANNSNNVAEYRALIMALECLLQHGYENARIKVNGDSKLVIEQMRGNWRAKAGLYFPYYHQAMKFRLKFSAITFAWIPRENNKQADALSKAHIKA